MTRLLGITLIALTIGCSNAPASGSVAAASAPAGDATGERNKAIVNTYLEAMNRGDTTAMAALMTDDFKGYGLGVKDLSAKQQTLKSIDDHWKEYKYGGKRYSRIDAIATTTAVDGGRGRPKGDWVFEWGDLAIDYPATDDYGAAKTATFQYHAAFRVVDGRIDTVTQYFNHEDIERQLGYLYVSPKDQPKVRAAGLEMK